MKSFRTATTGMYRPGFLLLVQLLVVAIFGIIDGNAFAASFSADFVKTDNGKTQTSPFFLLDDHYRFDTVDDGHKLAILVNRKSGKTRIVIYESKEYLEIENNGFQSIMNNPFEGYYMMRQKFETRMAGRETIDGIDCDKIVFTEDGKDLMTAWVAKSYAFPIRIENPATSDRVDLKNIRKERIDKAKFQVPAGYTEKEDPAKKRAREEAALAYVTTSVKGTAPWKRRIGPSGEMRVAVDPEKSVRIKFENFTQDEAVFSIKGFRAGRPITLDSQRTTFSLKGKGRSDDCLVGVQNQAEEIVVVVEKGKILAEVLARESNSPWETRRKTFFIDTGIRSSGAGINIDPKRQVQLNITSDSQDGSESKIKVSFYKDENRKDKITDADFVLINGKSRSWDYPPENDIRLVYINVTKGGGVQVILEQPVPGKKAAIEKKPPIQKAPQPKPKIIDKFTVTHPSGTGKPLTPGKDLAITVTGVSDDTAGTINLYTDRKKSKKIDTFTFKLKKSQAESLFVPGNKQVGWASVWVHKGSFKVELDQSGLKKPPPAPETKKPINTSAPKDEPSASNDTVLKGLIPVYKGAKIMKELTTSAGSKVVLEVAAGPEEIVNFYKQAMTAKGWQPGIAMVKGTKGMLQLQKGVGTIVLRSKMKGQMSTITIAVIGAVK